MSRAALVDLVLMLAAFAICAVIAEIAGSPNLGTSLTFGELGFAAAALYVLLRR